MKTLVAVLLLTGSCLPIAKVNAESIPTRFAATTDDRKAIKALLETYTKAVSTKDQASFETLLLNKDIPFSDVPSAVRSEGAAKGTEHYEDFRKGVFEGPAFTQRFQNVHIQQDGPLADVSLVFVNKDSQGTSWGWKTLQLLKVGGRWKIASEFFTGHPG